MGDGKGRKHIRNPNKSSRSKLKRRTPTCNNMLGLAPGNIEAVSKTKSWDTEPCGNRIDRTEAHPVDGRSSRVRSFRGKVRGSDPRTAADSYRKVFVCRIQSTQGLSPFSQLCLFPIGAETIFPDYVLPTKLPTVQLQTPMLERSCLITTESQPISEDPFRSLEAGRSGPQMIPVQGTHSSSTLELRFREECCLGLGLLTSVEYVFVCVYIYIYIHTHTYIHIHMFYMYNIIVCDYVIYYIIYIYIYI